MRNTIEEKDRTERKRWSDDGGDRQAERMLLMLLRSMHFIFSTNNNLPKIMSNVTYCCCTHRRAWREMMMMMEVFTIIVLSKKLLFFVETAVIDVIQNVLTGWANMLFNKMPIRRDLIKTMKKTCFTKIVSNNVHQCYECFT